MGVKHIGTYSSAHKANLEEIRVLRRVLLVYPTCIPPEDFTCNSQVLGRLEHQLACITLGDFNVPLEHIWVPETKLQCGNCHGLRNGAEIKNTLLPQSSQIEDTVFNVLQRVQYHLGAAVQCGFAVLGLEQILELVNMLRPDLLRPEMAIIIMVFPHITNNVRFLQE